MPLKMQNSKRRHVRRRGALDRGCATASAKIACDAARIACDMCEAAMIDACYARMEICCKKSCCLCDNELFFAGIAFWKLHVTSCHTWFACNMDMYDSCPYCMSSYVACHIVHVLKV
jgi:hypothetical protein